MRFCFFAANLHIGGGKVVGLNLTKSFLSIQKNDFEFFAVLPDTPEYRRVWEEKKEDPDRVRWVDLRQTTRTARIFDEIIGTYKKWMTAHKVDIAFNATNIPLVNISTPQILFLHNSYLILEKTYFKAFLSKKKYCKKLIDRKVLKLIYNIRKIDYVIVQTNFVAKAARKFFGADEAFVSYIYSSIGSEYKKAMLPKSYPSLEKTMNLIYPTKYYAHKNLEIIPEVLERLVKRVKRPFKLFLTLDTSQEKERQIVASLDFWVKKGIVINLGHQSQSEMRKNYQNAHILFMPTLLESFGLPFIEAMSFGLPIATSDREFARELCGDAALYFDPTSADSINETLAMLINDEERYSSLSARAIDRFDKIGLTWEEVSEKILKIAKDVMHKRNALVTTSSQIY